MRQRRIDRLLARADAAMAAGRPDDAREPFEELELLDPRSPRLAELRARANEPAAAPIADLELGPVAEIRGDKSGNRRWPRVAAALIAVGAAAWFAAPEIRIPSSLRAAISRATARSTTTSVADVASSSMPPVQVAVDEVPATSTVPEPPAVERVDASPVVAAMEQIPVLPPTVGDASKAPESGDDAERPASRPQARVADVERAPPPRPPAEEARSRAESTPPRTEPTPRRTEPTPPRTEPTPPRTEPTPARTESTPARTEPTVPRTEPTTGRVEPPTAANPAPSLPEVTSAVPARTVPERSVAPPPAPPTPTPMSSPPAASNSIDTAASARPAAEDGVRTTLSQYESAYSRLDVDAAGAVWPGLDRRALARAFDGLSAQRIDLGSCDVRIVAETARAECRGSATWTPKVGGRTQTERRQWQFRLRQASGGWQIVGATVR